MAENQSSLEKLIEIGQLDAVLSRIAAEKTQIEDKLQTQKQALNKAHKTLQERKSAVQLKEGGIRKEEKRLKDEQLKLVERRKALATFTNYKLQQAAEREIEGVSKQLSTQESSIVSSMDSLDTLTTALSEAQEKYDKLSKEFTEYEEESTGTLTTLEDRFAEKSKLREELFSKIEDSLLRTYKRTQNRYPSDPLVAVKNNSCSGCFMQLPPQNLNELLAAQKLVQCRGCGRILFLPAEEGSDAVSPDAVA
jgi:hypothetical protein